MCRGLWVLLLKAVTISCFFAWGEILPCWCLIESQAAKRGLDKDYIFIFNYLYLYIFCNSFILKVSKGYRSGTCAAESCTGSKVLIASLLLMLCKNCFYLPADGLQGKRSTGCRTTEFIR